MKNLNDRLASYLGGRLYIGDYSKFTLLWEGCDAGDAAEGKINAPQPNGTPDRRFCEARAAVEPPFLGGKVNSGDKIWNWGAVQLLTLWVCVVVGMARNFDHLKQKNIRWKSQRMFRFRM